MISDELEVAKKFYKKVTDDAERCINTTTDTIVDARTNLGNLRDSLAGRIFNLNSELNELNDLIRKLETMESKFQDIDPHPE